MSAPERCVECGDAKEETKPVCLTCLAAGHEEMERKVGLESDVMDALGILEKHPVVAAYLGLKKALRKAIP